MGEDTMMTSWQAGDIEANSIRLHYTRTSGDKLSLLLVFPDRLGLIHK